MHALDVLGDPVRRRILELIAGGETSAGEVGGVIHAEFGISQPAVSQHLRVLRESGFVTVRPEGTRRLYAVDSGPLGQADAWFDQFRRAWQPRLDALGTELARGRRAQRRPADPIPAAGLPADPPDANPSSPQASPKKSPTSEP